MQGLVDVRDGHANLRPRKQRDHFHVARSLPGFVHLIAAIFQQERLVLGTRPIDAIVAVIGRAGALCSASVDEELVEIAGRRSAPDGTAQLLPTVDDLAAADDGMLVGIGGPGDIGIARTESQGLRRR